MNVTLKLVLKSLLIWWISIDTRKLKLWESHRVVNKYYLPQNSNQSFYHSCFLPLSEISMKVQPKFLLNPKQYPLLAF